MDKRSYPKLIRMLDELSSEIDKSVEKVEEKGRKDAKKTFEYIARSAIDEFYESYTPGTYASAGRGYNRVGSLYSAFKVKISKDEWDIYYDWKYIEGKHRVSNEYIFNLAFMQGWHGGATSGEGHPATGTPWWRNYPFKKIETYEDPTEAWSRQAARSESPYEVIEKKKNEYLDSAGDEMTKNLNDIMIPKINSVKGQIIKLLKT